MDFATVAGKYYLSGSCTMGQFISRARLSRCLQISSWGDADVFCTSACVFWPPMLWTLFSSPLLPALHPHLFIPSLLYVPINKGGGGSPSCWEYHFQLLTLLPLLGRSTGKHAGQYPFRGKRLKSSCDSFHSIWRLCLDEFFLLEFYLDVSEGFLCFRGVQTSHHKIWESPAAPNHEAMLSY